MLGVIRAGAPMLEKLRALAAKKDAATVAAVTPAPTERFPLVPMRLVPVAGASGANAQIDLELLDLPVHSALPQPTDEPNRGPSVRRGPRDALHW